MRLLSPEAAGRLLGITAQRVRILIHSGRLKAQNVGGRYVIQEKDLKAVRVRKPGRPRKR